MTSQILDYFHVEAYFKPKEYQPTKKNEDKYPAIVMLKGKSKVTRTSKSKVQSTKALYREQCLIEATMVLTRKNCQH